MKIIKQENLLGNCKLKLLKNKGSKKYRFQIICCDYDKKKFVKLSLVNNLYNGNKVFSNILDFLKSFDTISPFALRQARVYYSFDRPCREENMEFNI